jgi:peptidoglycan/xylan/chitin deacetylase (PgdA/CDA1 family)
MSLFQLKCFIAKGLGRAIDLDSVIACARQRYVLGYHRVIPKQRAQQEFVQDAMWIAPETFESQLKWMRDIGEIVDYRRILDFEHTNEQPLFALTFDDGWEDNYEYAYPILKRYGVTATIFLVTSAAENGQLFWPEEFLTKTGLAIKDGKGNLVSEYLTSRLQGKLKIRQPLKNYRAVAEAYLEYLKLLDDASRAERLNDYYCYIGMTRETIKGPILSWNQIHELYCNGISFGSHTHTHRIIKGVAESLIEDEAQVSKQILESKLGAEIDIFAIRMHDTTKMTG